jgi:hypothetical protein
MSNPAPKRSPRWFVQAVGFKARRLTRRLTRRLSSRETDETTVDVFARWTAPIPPEHPSVPPGPHLVLLNDTRDQISVGSNALTDRLIALLRARVPNATIVPIPSHWLVEESAFPAFVDGGAGLRPPRATFPQLADQFETIADEWLAGGGGPDAGEYLRRLERADLVILNGEGSLYRTNVSAIRELFLAWLCKVRLGVPTVYLNGGLHLTGVLPILPAMARKTFAVLDAVAIREPWSIRNLEEYVPQVEAHLVPDAAYALRPADARSSAAVDAVRERIGDIPYFCFDPGAMPMDVLGGERSALYELITALKDVVPGAVYVSHSPPDDYIEGIARETGSIYVDTIRDYREYLALVADAEFVVTGRHHNVILASIVGCPSIAFGATTHKVHGACEWLEGLVGSPYDGTDIRPQLGTIVEHAIGYVRTRELLRERLLEVSARLRARTSVLGDLVAEALKASQPKRPEPLQGVAR